MTTHFNMLTPEEAERLAMLAEEAAEVIQVVGKILRHGYNSHHPDDKHNSNRDLLAKELSDLYAVTNRMTHNELKDYSIFSFPWRKWVDKCRYTHHQEQSPKEGSDHVR
jgi:hypothetical protein